MRVRKLDGDGDMRFGNQQSDFYRDNPEAVAQVILTRLRLWVGEWFIDVGDGTPYMEAMLGTGKRTTVEPAIRQRIKESEGVTAVTEFSINFDVDARLAAIVAIVDTRYGQATVAGAI